MVRKIVLLDLEDNLVQYVQLYIYIYLFIPKKNKNNNKKKVAFVIGLFVGSCNVF